MSDKKPEKVDIKQFEYNAQYELFIGLGTDNKMYQLIQGEWVLY